MPPFPGAGGEHGVGHTYDSGGVGECADSAKDKSPAVLWEGRLLTLVQEFSGTSVSLERLLGQYRDIREACHEDLWETGWQCLRRANQKLCVSVVLPMVQTLEILKHVSTITLGISVPKSSLEHKTI